MDVREEGEQLEADVGRVFGGREGLDADLGDERLCAVDGYGVTDLAVVSVVTAIHALRTVRMVLRGLSWRRLT